MSKAKYEIEVDAADDYDNSMDHNVKGADLKSTVMKKKGRGFSSSTTYRGLESVRSFDMLQQENVGRAQKSVEGWVIFVTGVHEECSEEDLNDKFADFGPIKDIKMPLDHRTGYVKGYALIEYNTHAEAKAAIDNMNGQLVMEQEVRCDWAFIRGSARSGHRDELDSEQREVYAVENFVEDREIRAVDGNESGRKIIVYNDI